ncbi:MAG TPA: hypothetical protein VF406_06340 [Thermodesulfobacteriota bacterium]
MRRVTPPAPFAVDETPAATSALDVEVSGLAEPGIPVIVRVEGGAGLVEVRKAAGEARFVSAPRATLRGQAPGAVSVQVDTPADGRLSAPVASDGAFRLGVVLPATLTPVSIDVEAVDAAGNRSAATTLRALAVGGGLGDGGGERGAR